MAGAQAEIDALLAQAEALSQDEKSAQAAADRAEARQTAGPIEGVAVQSDGSPVPEKVQRILRLRVPLMVVLAERKMSVREILHVSIGSIIEFSKPFDEELGLLVKNQSIAYGQAVKIGENFGLRVTRVADVKARINAMGNDASAEPPAN